MSLRYERNALATVFYKLNGEDEKPSEAKLKAIADEFFNDYEGGNKNILEEAMVEKGIPATKENKSSILLLIKMNSVGGRRSYRANAACTFFVDSGMEGRGGPHGPPGQPL